MSFDFGEHNISFVLHYVEIDGIDGLDGWIGEFEYVTDPPEVHDDTIDLIRYLLYRKAIPPFKINRIFDGDERLKRWSDQGAKCKLSGSIIYLEQTGEEVRLNWRDGYILTYASNKLAAEGSKGIAIESVTIVVGDLMPG